MKIREKCIFLNWKAASNITSFYIEGYIPVQSPFACKWTRFVQLHILGLIISFCDTYGVVLWVKAPFSSKWAVVLSYWKVFVVLPALSIHSYQPCDCSSFVTEMNPLLNFKSKMIHIFISLSCFFLIVWLNVSLSSWILQYLSHRKVHFFMDTYFWDLCYASSFIPWGNILVVHIQLLSE